MNYYLTVQVPKIKKKNNQKPDTTRKQIGITSGKAGLYQVKFSRLYCMESTISLCSNL